MKNYFPFVYFLILDKSSNKSAWYCYDSFNNKLIGKVEYHIPTKSYCYFPDITLPYNYGMLNNILKFITILNNQ